MNLKIGSRIAGFRKEKGMTQEQLAEALGVSAPAVSKWETDSSYPDITMLCPLARALGTDVDTLLNYEEELTESRICEHINRIVEMAEKQDVLTAEKELQSLLCQYPASVPLKFHAAAVLTTFSVFCEPCPEERKAQWERQKKNLLWQVYQSGNSKYFQSAVSALAAMAIHENNPEQAQKLLQELPERVEDATFLRVSLYLKQNDREKALETVQKTLYTRITNVLSCLVLLMEEKIESDPEKALELCGIYRQVEEIFWKDSVLSGGLLPEIYLRMGKKQEAAESLMAFLDRMDSQTAAVPNPLLFAPTIQAEGHRGNVKETLRSMTVRALRSDAALKELCDVPGVKEKMEKVIGGAGKAFLYETTNG